jgi:pimeloyl-ACP methyl ester carboxylesterase
MPCFNPHTQKETVVLLHGIGHSKWNMFLAEKALRKQNYHTLNITYPSLKKDIKSLAGFIHEYLQSSDVWNTQDKVHFVTHSMGGLVARQYLDDYKTSLAKDKLGRVVMLAPPHSGSEVADLLKNFPPYKWLFGPAGQELTTINQAQNTALPYYDLGIIAGSLGWPYILGNLTISDRHDGRVAVERTKLLGMKDHMTIAATHSFISWQPRVHKQIVYFLKNGVFYRDV